MGKSLILDMFQNKAALEICFYKQNFNFTNYIGYLNIGNIVVTFVIC